MKLIIDMNLSVDWVPALRSADIEARQWATLGRENAPDETILAWASDNQAVVLTRDLDFATMLTMQKLRAPSVIQLRIAQVRPSRHLPLVQSAISQHRARLEQGAIITLDGERVRIRILDPDLEP